MGGRHLVEGTSIAWVCSIEFNFHVTMLALEAAYSIHGTSCICWIHLYTFELWNVLNRTPKSTIVIDVLNRESQFLQMWKLFQSLDEICRWGVSVLDIKIG